MRESRVGRSPCRKRFFCAGSGAQIYGPAFSRSSRFSRSSQREPRLTVRVVNRPSRGPDCFTLSTTVLHAGERERLKSGLHYSKDFKCLYCFRNGCYGKQLSGLLSISPWNSSKNKVFHLQALRLFDWNLR